MQTLKQTISDLIEEHKKDLLDSHAKYGGVYIGIIDMEDEGKSFEVELDDGVISFTLTVKDNTCLDCGHEEFSGNQICRVNVVVDAKNNFIRNQEKTMEASVYDADNPYGMYSCLNCGKEYEDVCVLANNCERLLEILDDKLRENGIGVYGDYESFEEAINKFHNLGD